jgi:hypothetical protein
MEVVVEHEQHLAIVGASYASFLDPRRRDDDGQGGGLGAAGTAGGAAGAGGPRLAGTGRPLHWDAGDTRIFYDALRQVGTDFNLMRSYFDHRRTRRQLKRKYQSELVKNPDLVERALHPVSKKRIGACSVWTFSLLDSSASSRRLSQPFSFLVAFATI